MSTKPSTEQETSLPLLNFEEWKGFSEQYGLISESLWLIPERDNNGSLKLRHHGEFISQIPRQAILRFTKPYNLIVDPFVGYGTTLVECQRLGRNGIGIELEHSTAEVARGRILEEPNPYGVKVEVLEGDSGSFNFRKALLERGFLNASLVIAHPPYHDIIKYGGDAGNLANAPTVGAFLQGYGKVLDSVASILAERGYYVLVMGDKYAGGEWVPLGFYMMNETMKRGLRLKAICVKNIEETLAKRLLENLRTVRRVFSASKRDFMRVPGIGEQKATRISRLLDARLAEED